MSGASGYLHGLGGTITHFSPPMHGKLSRITHTGAGIFEGLEQGFVVTRYHSLVAEAKSLPDCLEAVFTQADADNRKIMAVRHKEYDIYGVQFHPELSHRHKAIYYWCLSCNNRTK